MSEAETNLDDGDALPVLKLDADAPPAVLAYANLRGAQPAQSQFVCERHADGSVTLTEPPNPRDSLGTRVAGMLMILLAAIWLGFSVYYSFGDHWRHVWPGTFISPLVMGLLGALVW